MGRPRREPFSSRLAEHRVRAGLTQEQAAEAVGITVEMVRRHEHALALPVPSTRHRYAVLYGATLAALWPPTALDLAEQPVLPPVTPERADETYLATIRGYISTLIGLDNRFGGGDLVRLAVRTFNDLHGVIGHGGYPRRLRRDLYAAAGELAEVAGWIAYDAQDHALTRRMNTDSLYFSRLAGDRTIELLTLQNASMHAGALGRPGEALQVACSVLDGPYALTPRLRALFLVRKARALAQGGDTAAVAVLAEARSLYLEGVGPEDPPWAWWIDDREVAWHEGMALADLGRPGHALADLERSVEACPPGQVRSQYVHRAYLLDAQLQVRSWVDAEETMRTLTPLVGRVGSTRAAGVVRGALTGLDGVHAPGAVRDGAAALTDVLDRSA